MEAIQKYDTCVRELAGYAHGIGFEDVILGLSGGIDSAVVAVMCVDAFGPEHVHAYLMPGPYSTDHSLVDAQEEARVLGISTHTLSIQKPYEAFAEVLAPVCDDSFIGMASQNTQARCRMICLMAISNHHGWMVVNTGNKSEAMMGYSTMYGDMAGAFAPIGGLYKTDVYAVARARNTRAEAEGGSWPIPENVLLKPPSAELAPDQRDENSLGIDYDSLDKILIGHYEEGLSASSLAQGVLLGVKSEEEIGSIIRRADACAFKRAYEPPFPRVRFY